MLDASKYSEHFPDEKEKIETPPAQPAVADPAPHIVRPSLLSALSELEKEFRDILLRAQQSAPTDPAA
jgi:hypothetical protein